MYKQFVVFLAVFGFVYGSNLPSEFKTCKRSEENVDGCLKVAIQEGIQTLLKGYPALGFPSLSPLKIPSMTIGEGSGAVHVVQKYKNVSISFTKTTVEKVKTTITPTSAIIEYDSFAADLKLKADYEFNGRILVLPIVGSGKSTILLKQLKTNLKISGETFEKNGKKYMEVKDVKFTLKPEKVEYNFENLFDGDERLGKEMNKVLNDNWKEVFEDVRPGYEEALSIIIKNLVNIVFNNIPYDDIFLE